MPDTATSTGSPAALAPTLHAARLEAATDLQLLELEPDLGHVEPEGSAWQSPERRVPNVAGDALPGVTDQRAVGHGGVLQRHHAIVAATFAA
jgi:hypothetical protein